MKVKWEVGDIQTDPDGSEWVVISPPGLQKASRVKRYSPAHYLHAKFDPAIAKSLEEDVDGSRTETASTGSTDEAA